MKETGLILLGFVAGGAGLYFYMQQKQKKENLINQILAIPGVDATPEVLQQMSVKELEDILIQAQMNSRQSRRVQRLADYQRRNCTACYMIQ